MTNNSSKKNTSKFLPNIMWNICGIITTTLGVIGIFVPVLPTTPFLLLSAFCFNRGSERMRKWFNNNKVFSTYLDNYRTNAGVPLLTKIISISVLWLTIGLSFYFSENTWVRILLVAVVIGVTIHLMKMKTRK